MAWIIPRHGVSTSIIRPASQRQTSGFLNVIDLETGSVLCNSTLPSMRSIAMDNNPRGRLRSARGLARNGQREYLPGSQCFAAFHVVGLDSDVAPRAIELQEESKEMVHGICPRPEDFETPGIMATVPAN
jgi:hypothetical protein